MHTQPALQLHERLQLLRISSREYRLLSLFDSLTVRTSEATDGVLDRVLPALERGADLPSLVLGLPKRDARAVRALVRDLDARGLLERDGPEHDAPHHASHGEFARQRRFFANFQAVGDMTTDRNANAPDAASTLQGRLARATVMVVGLGRVGAQVARALEAAGVGNLIRADDTLGRSLGPGSPAAPLFGSRDPILPAGVDFVALCEDAFDPDHHAAINRAALRAKVPWIGYRLLRTRLEIGPTVIPFETACFHCYELRRTSNSAGFADELELQRRLVANGIDLGSLNVTLGADLLALEIVKSLTQFTSAATYGHVYVMDIVSLDTHVRPVLKIPRCPECGAAAGTPQSDVWQYDAELEPQA